MGGDDNLAGELLRELIAERFIEPLASALAQAGTPSVDPRLAAKLAATREHLRGCNRPTGARHGCPAGIGYGATGRSSFGA